MLTTKSIAAGMTCGIATISFAASAPALYELAIQAHIGPAIAWAIPVLIDSTVVVSAVSVPTLSKSPRRSTRMYPLFVALAGAAVSCTANAAHAVSATIDERTAVLIGIAAPLSLLVSSHLLLLISQAAPAKAVARGRATSAPRTAATPTRPAAATVRTAGATTSRDAVVARIKTVVEQTGEWPSAETVGEWLSASARTGRRVLAQARTEAS